MMDFISLPTTFGIGAFAFYKVVELFVRKKERLMIIDRLSSLEGISSEKLDFSKLFPQDTNDRGQYLALRFGSLIMGLGLGLLVGYFIGLESYTGLSLHADSEVYYRLRETTGLIYGASTLMFGGLGLIIGFLIEFIIRKNKK